MNISSDIKDAIEKHLPGMVGQTLQKELARIPELEASLKEARDSVELQRALNDKLTKQLKAQDAVEAQDRANKKREAELTECKNQLDKDRNELEVQRAVSKAVSDQQTARVSDMKDLVAMIFKGPVVRQEVYQSINKQVPPPAGGYGAVNLTESVNTTTRTIPE